MVSRVKAKGAAALVQTAQGFLVGVISYST